jgi:hypothetical protein
MGVDFLEWCTFGRGVDFLELDVDVEAAPQLRKHREGVCDLLWAFGFASHTAQKLIACRQVDF